ncbi:muskelin [Bicyclus anynana]|uniref:Muskelin n=1 Tax=Bicyclus anynana TaxID=110368 RepID=A0ABM3LWX9_BICAN|nr:muskelin [Bicyclus anynana]
MDDKYETVVLKYTIHKYSSYSANYLPENIMVNDPPDQLSRWFTDSTTPSQFIMLKLETPAIVESIMFGKYIKAHVSDLKKFQIFGGTDKNNLSLLLTAGLKMDYTAETFKLRHRTSDGLYLPVKYIKIVPLQSWGPAYNYTIWYVELQGKNHEDLINSAMDTINLRKEEEAVRILLKHLRRRRYKDAFEALSRESGVQLEGAAQARLWQALVENGDYTLAEQIFDEAAEAGELDWYMSWQPYTPEWRQLCCCSPEVEDKLRCEAAPVSPSRRSHPELSCADGEPRPDVSLVNGAEAEGEEYDACGGCETRPGPRGGHQLVVDPSTGTLYLFGGWNGSEDLDDLWSYDTGTERWTLLCRHSEAVNGPSPRSCHKMVFDPVHEKLYTLGRYLDNARRVPSNMYSDLYVYDARAGEWALLCGDTAAAGGPRLVFDHQMCIDHSTQTIYVFGGRVLPANTEELASPQYSGLYAYYIARNTWQLLLADSHELPAPQARVSHSMLFHPVRSLCCRLHHTTYSTRGCTRTTSRATRGSCCWPTRTSCPRRRPASRTPCCSTRCAACVADSTTLHTVLGAVRVLHRAQHVAAAAGRLARAARAAGPRLALHAVPPGAQLVLPTPPHYIQYSGLYAYYIARNTWQLLLADSHELPAPQARVSHSMLFHPFQRRLYMFAGQRNKEQLVDLWWWDCESGTARALCAAPARAPPPQGFTHRATLDPDTDEIHVLSGMSKEKDKRVYNTLWVLSLRRMTWTCVYRNDSVSPSEPRPRFAHQLVYDPVRKIHYLFGGNPGVAGNPRLRLDDFWSLRLRRASVRRAADAARAALREARYRELCGTPQRAPRALHYLRHDLRAVTDLADPQQVEHFHKLATVLFAGSERAEGGARALSGRRVRALARRRAALRLRAHDGDMALALAAVLGADDSTLEPTEPFEESSSPTPDTWDVGTDEDDAPDSDEWDERSARMRLYDQLCQYFRPSAVPPAADVTDLVHL